MLTNHIELILDGESYYLENGGISFGQIPHFLYYCARRYGYLYERNPEIPMPTSMDDLNFRKAERDHRKVYEDLGLEIGKTCEVPIYLEYGGFRFQCPIDIHDSLTPGYFEELKFRESDKVDPKPNEFSQSEAIAYSLMKNYNLDQVEYTYKIWAQDEDPRKDPLKGNIYHKVFTKKDWIKIEWELDRMVEFFSGQVPCYRAYYKEPIPPGKKVFRDHPCDHNRCTRDIQRICQALPRKYWFGYK